MASEWTTVRAADFIEFNPRLSIKKGALATKVCSVSCIGCGKCVRTCQHNAIKVTDFLARIDRDVCVACGECIVACPRHSILCKPKIEM